MSVARSIFARFARIFAFAGLAAYFVGSMLALYSGNADAFHRFGALGVAASFLFFSDRLTKIELGRQRSVERLLHEYGVELAALRQGKPATEIPLEGFAVDFLTEERNFDQLRRQADVFNVLNVLLMTAATLQWGFGDLAVLRLMGCGELPC
jgi:hypothetical protein